MTAAVWLIVCGVAAGRDADEQQYNYMTGWENAPLQEQAGRGEFLNEMVKSFDPGCIQQKCAHALTACEDERADCKKRADCLFGPHKDPKATHHCFDGVHLLDLTDGETHALGCAEKERCVMLDDETLHNLRIMAKQKLAEKSKAQKSKTAGKKHFTGKKHKKLRHKMSLLQYKHDDSDDAAVMGDDLPDYQGLARAKAD